MEQFLDDSSNILVKDNNNVVDNLELLKENQTNTMQTAEQIDLLVNEQEPKTDDLLNLNEEIDEKIKPDEESNIKFEDLIENNESDELIKELIGQANESTNQTANDQLDEILIETSENKTESTDLSKSTIQLLEDLNDTPNALNSSKNTADSEFNLTAETFLEQPRESIENRVLIDNSLDTSVKEIISQNDLNLDNNQSQSEAKNLNDTNEITKEIFLGQSNHNQDYNELTDQSIQEFNLADQFTKQQISLVEISDENVSDDLIKQKGDLSLLGQMNKSEECDDKINILDTLMNNDKKEETEFLEDFSKEIDKKVNDLINDFKPEEENQDQKLIEQTPDQAKLTLEDFVTRNEEVANDESNNDNQIKEDSFIVKKLDECKISTEELKNATETERVQSEISQKIEEDETEIVHEASNLDNQEAVSSKSKVNDIFTESQELLKQADKLIAEKRNSINKINIPGLNVKTTAESIEGQTADEQTEQSTKEQEPSLSEPLKTNEAANENARSKSLSRRCVIS